MQERLNAVQEELKREVAAAEVARGRAMTVLRRQATLKEVIPAPLCGWWLLAALHHESQVQACAGQSRGPGCNNLMSTAMTRIDM